MDFKTEGAHRPVRNRRDRLRATAIMNRFLSVCRKVHSWLGVFILPWVLLIGLTGIYLNHPKPFHQLLGEESLTANTVAALPAENLSKEAAEQIALSVWPDQPIQKAGMTKYRNNQSLAFQKEDGHIIIPVPKARIYFVVTPFREFTYALDGKLVHQQYNLKRLFKTLHERGWASKRFGTWFADIVAGAMVFFGLTGFIMWLVPKVRRLRRHIVQRRRSRQQQTAESSPIESGFGPAGHERQWSPRS